MEGREQDDFLSLFYESFVHKMVVPVAGKTAAGTGPLSNDAENLEPSEEEIDGDVLSARQHVCEILSFCVQKHSYRIKYFILRNNVINKVLTLAKLRDKCLVLGLHARRWPPLSRAAPEPSLSRRYADAELSCVRPQPR